MNNNYLLVAIILLALKVAQCQQQAPIPQNLLGEQVNNNFPYYLQSPINQQQQPQETFLTSNEEQLAQRSQVPVRTIKRPGGARKLEQVSGPEAKSADNCLYNKNYFAKLDECLTRKPYPTIGLPAFKNEDLLVKRSLKERNGCVFILNNGLFKNFQITKFSLDSDTQCLDNTKVGISMGFNNVTLAYLWTLRCLNKADQLLDDAGFESKTTKGSSPDEEICVGSSQSFGFTALQLTGVEAQVELLSDIYKNWRITNITTAMLNPINGLGTRLPTSEATNEELLGTSIKDYVFESLDGDELNWRYLHLFQNWSRNKMHSNFLEQYRRFLWISLQRCLSETSDRLPVKLVDLFANQRLY